MATLTAIRTAIETTINNGDVGLKAYATVEDIVVVPSLLVLPAEGPDFMVTFARGSDTYQFDLFTMTSRVVPRAGQEALDAYVSGTGPRSLRQLFWANKSLGLSDGTEATARGWSRYGGSFSTVSIDHVGAVLRLSVMTPGT